MNLRENNKNNIEIEVKETKGDDKPLEASWIVFVSHILQAMNYTIDFFTNIGQSDSIGM